jgi:CRP-like cAMP-binding protein
MLGYGLMQAIGQRLDETERRLEEIAFGTVSSRLAALLLELDRSDPKGTVRATHQQLADMLGTWRETVSKTLGEFRRKGLVGSGRRELTLLDPRGLSMEAGILV